MEKYISRNYLVNNFKMINLKSGEARVYVTKLLLFRSL